MFIKKDLRKIPRILAEAAPIESERLNHDENVSKRIKRDVLTELHLARRKAEFQGSLSVLCHPSNSPSLHHLLSLSIYDCDIKSLEGIGLLGSVVDGARTICCPSLESLNVGRNPLTTLPDELSMLSRSLKELWCDDCQIQGTLPPCIVALDRLETLHLANNQITDIPPALSNLQELKQLSLDHNRITFLPEEVVSLPKLEVLLLRQNLLSRLPHLPKSLRLLHVSSNLLECLPSSIVGCIGLQHLFANNNKLTSMPLGIENFTCLQRLNLSNNQIAQVSGLFTTHFGEPDKTTGLCKNDLGCVTFVGQNPFMTDFTSNPDMRRDQVVLAR